MVATAGGARDVAAVLFFHTGNPHPTNQPLPPEITCSAWPIRRGYSPRGFAATPETPSVDSKQHRRGPHPDGGAPLPGLVTCGGAVFTSDAGTVNRSRAPSDPDELSGHPGGASAAAGPGRRPWNHRERSDSAGPAATGLRAPALSRSPHKGERAPGYQTGSPLNYSAKPPPA